MIGGSLIQSSDEDLLSEDAVMIRIAVRVDNQMGIFDLKGLWRILRKGADVEYGTSSMGDW